VWPEISSQFWSTRKSYIAAIYFPRICQSKILCIIVLAAIVRVQHGNYLLDDVFLLPPNLLCSLPLKLKKTDVESYSNHISDLFT